MEQYDKVPHLFKDLSPHKKAALLLHIIIGHLEPIRKLLNRTRYAHKRTAQRPTNFRFSCTIGCEYCAFWPTNQMSFPRPIVMPDASRLQELVLVRVRRDAVGERCVSHNWLR